VRTKRCGSSFIAPASGDGAALPEAELQLLRAQAGRTPRLRVLKLLALVRFKLGRLAEARQIYREAAQIAPEDAAIRLNLASSRSSWTGSTKP